MLSLSLARKLRRTYGKANLLRILRESDGPMNIAQIYEKAVEREAGVHSKRHMKGLLLHMRRLARIKAQPPAVGDGELKSKKRVNWVFTITQQGENHVNKLDALLE